MGAERAERHIPEYAKRLVAMYNARGEIDARLKLSPDGSPPSAEPQVPSSVLCSSLHSPPSFPLPPPPFLGASHSFRPLLLFYFSPPSSPRPSPPELCSADPFHLGAALPVLRTRWVSLPLVSILLQLTAPCFDSPSAPVTPSSPAPSRQVLPTAPPTMPCPFDPHLVLCGHVDMDALPPSGVTALNPDTWQALPALTGPLRCPLLCLPLPLLASPVIDFQTSWRNGRLPRAPLGPYESAPCLCRRLRFAPLVSLP